MVSCANCGAKNPEDATYCAKCGARLEKRARPIRRREEADYLGALSAGVVLIILALTYLRYPFDLSLIVNYFESLATYQRFIKPPLALLNPVIFFFNAVGVWSLALSALRIVFQRRVRRAIGDLVGGLFSFFVAFLLTSYANDVLRGQAVLAYFVIGIGVVVVVNAIIHFAYPER